MASLSIKGNVFVNPRLFIERLVTKHGRNTAFVELVPRLQDGEVDLEPGDYLRCVTHGNLREEKIGVGDIKEKLFDYLKSPDAHMIYHGFQVPQAVRAGNEVAEFNFLDGLVFENFGDTALLQSEDGVVAFPSSELSTVDKYHRSFVSLQGFNVASAGGGRIEITHIGGFEKELNLRIPAHLEENGEWGPAILKCSVRLPKKPEEKILKLSRTVKDGEPAIIDIGKLGLYVPLGDTTFTRYLIYDVGGINSYVLESRIINGLMIAPENFGKTLKIVLAEKPKEQEKNILTHLYDKNNKIEPVKLAVTVK